MEATAWLALPALFSLQLPLAAVTEGFDALRGSHPRRSSVCGPANHAIFLSHAAALFSLQLPLAAVTAGLADSIS